MSMFIEVWGDYACFSRPEMKTERVSYDVITPSAARGLVEARSVDLTSLRRMFVKRMGFNR